MRITPQMGVFQQPAKVQTFLSRFPRRILYKLVAINIGCLGLIFPAFLTLEILNFTALFILLFLGDIGLPFPENTTLILGGFLIVQDVTKL
jgi:membrane protein DedA with SNARE-associated domain